MNILAIETATDWCGVGFIQNKVCIAKIEKRIPKQHAELLPVFYQSLKKKINLNEIKINAVAISIGPGSFTGLRVGLGFSKGLAYAKDLPIIPVSTLHSLAINCDLEEEISILLYSHRDIVYEQSFKKDKATSSVKAVQWKNINHSKKIFHYGCQKLINNEKYKTVSPSVENIGQLATKYYKNWIINKPYDLVPNYVSPFGL